MFSAEGMSECAEIASGRTVAIVRLSLLLPPKVPSGRRSRQTLRAPSSLHGAFCQA